MHLSPNFDLLALDPELGRSLYHTFRIALLSLVNWRDHNVCNQLLYFVIGKNWLFLVFVGYMKLALICSAMLAISVPCPGLQVVSCIMKLGLSFLLIRLLALL